MMGQAQTQKSHEFVFLFLSTQLPEQTMTVWQASQRSPLSAALTAGACAGLCLLSFGAFWTPGSSRQLQQGALRGAVALSEVGQMPDAAVAVTELKVAGHAAACSCASLLGDTDNGSPLSLVGGAIAQVKRNIAAGRRLIVLINYTGRVGWHFGQQGATYIQERVLAALFGCDTEVVAFWEPQPKSTDFGSLTTALAEAALVVVNAEGTLHHRRTPLHASLELLTAPRSADVPLWIINASFQYNMSASANGTLEVFRGAAFAAARDGLSHAVLRSALPWAQHLTLSADLTMLLPSYFSPDVEGQLAERLPAWSSTNLDKGGPLRIVLAASSLSPDKYPPLWAALVPLVLATHPGSTFILALDCGRPQTAAAWAKLPSKFPGAKFEELCKFETLAHVLWQLRNADVYIGGRFHAATYSLLAGLPAVLLPGNTWKVEAWAALVSSPGVAYMPEGVAAGAKLVWQRAQTVMAQREALAGRDLAGLRQLALHNFPLAGPVQTAGMVTSQELRMQRTWLAQQRLKRSTFCERFGFLPRDAAGNS